MVPAPLRLDPDLNVDVAERLMVIDSSWSGEVDTVSRKVAHSQSRKCLLFVPQALGKEIVTQHCWKLVLAAVGTVHGLDRHRLWLRENRARA